MKLGILQFKPLLCKTADNLKTIKRLLARRKFDLAVIPELATSGYNFADRNQALSVAAQKGDDTFDFFRQLAGKTGGAIVWGTPEKSGRKLYNTAVLSTPEGKHHLYRKTHLFFREKLLFDPGNSGLKVFKWRGYRIGIMICFDWIFPEAARTLALKRCQVICHPSNLVMKYCQAAMITRSIENGIYTATANRIGRETNAGLSLTFTGRSQVTDYRGKRLLTFSKTEESFKIVKIKPEMSDTKKVNQYNSLLTDRRPDCYKL